MNKLSLLYQTLHTESLKKSILHGLPLIPLYSFSFLSTELSLINPEEPTDINTYDQSIVERLRLLDQLGEQEKKSIFNIIDIAITKKRLKDTLSNALNNAT